MTQAFQGSREQAALDGLSPGGRWVFYWLVACGQEGCPRGQTLVLDEGGTRDCIAAGFAEAFEAQDGSEWLRLSELGRSALSLLP